MTNCRHHLPALALLALSLAACRGEHASTPPVTAASSNARSAQAESSIDGVTMHVSEVQTSQLPESVAREYGLDRSPRTVLLLVNLHGIGKGPAPVISATATDLLQHTTPVSLRAAHVPQPDPGIVDYIGTVDITLPDTLRFTVVARHGGATSTVQVSRDFYPQ
jgi:hypothetical protein